MVEPPKIAASVVVKRRGVVVIVNDAFGSGDRPSGRIGRDELVRLVDAASPGIGHRVGQGLQRQ